MDASGFGYVDVVTELLLAPSIDVNFTGFHGWTALIMASVEAHADVVKNCSPRPASRSI